MGRQRVRHARFRRATSVALVIGLCAGGFALGAAGASALWNGDAGEGIFGVITNGSFSLEVDTDSLEVPANAANAGEITFDAAVTLSGNTLKAQLRLDPAEDFDGALGLDSWGYDCEGGAQQDDISIGTASVELTPMTGQETRTCEVTVKTYWTEGLKRLSAIDEAATQTGTWPFVLTMEQAR